MRAQYQIIAPLDFFFTAIKAIFPQILRLWETRHPGILCLTLRSSSAWFTQPMHLPLPLPQQQFQGLGLYSSPKIVCLWWHQFLIQFHFCWRRHSAWVLRHFHKKGFAKYECWHALKVWVCGHFGFLMFRVNVLFWLIQQAHKPSPTVCCPTKRKKGCRLWMCALQIKPHVLSG